MGEEGTNLLIAAAILAIPAVADAQGNEAVIFNQSSYTIHSLYISPSASNEWGTDHLGQEMSPPGGTYDVRRTSRSATLTRWRFR